ncbi:inosine-5-monophosphate dehydrogenase [Jannaschia pagri]|uniref:Inosine-5-monophosphate dehydrogenase n=1 Tax=Jannaschia pagri TaxID=2829797 RepID=A0ABQ4NP92_9RHOB|nr:MULTISPECIES: CBS domain-containing protein [unclassified Jannaschia]GIT92398.1 inosine-5-monophosphate dehydrogenase [Jannaschia sp. AI_61]GIT96233.1 inosine-5-monophosphate dehydrogenase [Jannaschia sp. AI_62]
MFVTKILATKSNQGVLTIGPEASIADAVAELGARKIGALVVSADGRRAQGILSERDIVREMAKTGGDVLSQTVASLMTRDLQTCAPGDRSDAVLERMTTGRFRHMPVEEDGLLVGLISLGDVVKARLSEVSMEKDALEAMISGH